MITDCHIHIHPPDLVLKPGAEALMHASGAQYEQMRQFARSPCLSPVVLLCNPHITKEAAPFGSLEGTLPERGRKTLLADLSQSLEAGSEGQGGGGKGRFTRRV